MKSNLLLITLAAVANAHADPILTSWYTENSSALARVIQTTNTTSGTRNTTPVTTWPTTGITNNNTNAAAQTTALYADVQRIRYTATDVYINSSGLSSYTMGPFLNGNGGLFGFWPLGQNYTTRITRSPVAPAVKTSHGGGLIGMMVNGVGIYDLGDAFAFVQSASSPVAGSDAMGQTNSTRPWWRDALAVEVVTFDPGFAHQPGINGQYHYHAQPKALRYQLRDNMQATYSGAPNNSYTYTEDTSKLHHSPILGWCFDGYPIYGPYAYSDPTNTTSAVIRMRSGFAKRDGTNGTTNVISAGRTTLPKWATIAEGLLTTATYLGTGAAYSNGDFILSATLQGPATTYTTTGPGGTTTYSLGRYIGDYEFLGDRGFSQTTGAVVRDFDLDLYNGRTCKTPEFPNGTYAYFVTLDATGNPAFPYLLGKQYYGTRNGGTGATVPATGVTELFNMGGTNLVETTTGAPSINTSTGDVTLTWSSVEGGTYTVQASDDLSAWTSLNSAVPARVNTVLPAPSNVITTTSLTDPAAALPGNHSKRFYRVTRN